jgi:cell division protein FtsZ
MGILTVGVVTKPFHFEGQRRMRTAEAGIAELHKVVDTLLIIPNQNLFRVANEKTTFADAFAMADQVLYSGVACITDLMVKEGLINLDFADVRAVMREMGKAMMGTGEASGEKRALTAAEAAIANPLIDDSSMKGARGLLISITGGKDLTLFEVDEAATRIREEVDQDANIIVGATFDETLDGVIRVSVVATGIEQALISRNAAAPAAAPVANAVASSATPDSRLADLTARLRADNQRIAERAQKLETPAAPPQRTSGSVERAALAAIAAAVAPEVPQPASYGDVTVRPIVQKPSLFPDHDVTRVVTHEPATPETFIPQAAERAPLRAPRMPKFEDLPMPAQNEIRQARGEVDEEHPQKTRMSLLQRLANVGLGRRDEEAEPPIAARASGPAMAPMPPLPERKPQRSVAQQIAATEPVSEYARRPAPQGLDAHGRPAPVAAAPQGDDHLDIPAFLRRQAT